MIKAIHILPAARAKMEAYVRNCPFEISGLGIVEEHPEMLLVTDVFLLEQLGSAGSTLLDPKDLSKFVVDMAIAGGDPSKLKFWWHSHVNMPCYWSSTDDKCMDAFKPDTYFIGTVCNKKGESRTRLDIYSPIRASIDNIPLLSPIDEVMETEVRLEIKAKVTEAIYPAFVMGTGKRSKFHRSGQRAANNRLPLCEDGDTTYLLPDLFPDSDGDSDGGLLSPDDGPMSYSEEEFTTLANGMDMTFDELLEQEGMQLSHGWVF